MGTNGVHREEKCHTSKHQFSFPKVTICYQCLVSSFQKYSTYIRSYVLCTYISFLPPSTRTAVWLLTWSFKPSCRDPRISTYGSIHALLIAAWQCPHACPTLGIRLNLATPSWQTFREYHCFGSHEHCCKLDLCTLAFFRLRDYKSLETTVDFCCCICELRVNNLASWEHKSPLPSHLPYPWASL